jgi:hypothetical protein
MIMKMVSSPPRECKVVQASRAAGPQRLDDSSIGADATSSVTRSSLHWVGVKGLIGKMAFAAPSTGIWRTGSMTTGTMAMLSRQAYELAQTAACLLNNVQLSCMVCGPCLHFLCVIHGKCYEWKGAPKH